VNGKIRPAAAFVIFSCIVFHAPALGRKDTAVRTGGTPTAVSDMFFEILRYDTTGVSNFPDISEYTGVSGIPAAILMHPVWQKNVCPLYLIEKAVPSYTGKLDASFSSECFQISQSYGWIDDLLDEAASEKAGKALEALEMQPPEELAQGKAAAASGVQEAAQGEQGTTDNQNTEESPSEKRYRTAEGRLRLFSFDTEFFSVSGNTENRVLVNAGGKTAVRKFYDFLSRLTKQEYWTIADTSAQSAVTRTDTFYYTGDEIVPFSSVTDISGERVESLYTEKGRVYSRTVYSVGDDKTRRIESRTLWKYGDNAKITEEENTRFLYDAVKKNVQTGTIKRKDVYAYTSLGRSPDYYYYEDDRLRMKTVYSAEDEYTTTLYFDGNFTVIAEYRSGRKVKETFMRGNTMVRSRTYDNE